MIRHLTFSFIFTLLSSVVSVSGVSSSGTASVQWQRFELENSLRERLTQVVKQVVDEKKFFIEVQIGANTPVISIPKYRLSKIKRAKLTNNKRKGNGEYILFDKLGLNAPKFEGSYSLRHSDLQLKILQYQKKLESDFFQKMDLFTNIESIKVKIGLDKTISPDKAASIKNLVVSMLPKFGDIEAEVDVVTINFKVAQKEPFIKNISYVSGPIGFIVAAILFCITALLLFGKYRKLRAESAKKEEAVSAQQKEEAEEHQIPSSESQIDPNLRPGSSQLADAIENTNEGVERFCLYLEKSYDQATNLIKKWVNLNSKLSSAGLVVLSERLSVEELFKIFIKLTIEERLAFRKLTLDEISVAEKASADKYIGQQVLEDIISVTVIEDKELQQLLVEISPEKAAELVSNYPDEGAFLINLVSGDFLGKMFQLVEVEKTKELTEKALSVKEADFNGELDSLKKILKKYVDAKYRNPFERRVVEVMKELDFVRSENLLDVLIDSGQFEIIEDVIRSSFPARLIDRLPSNILKGIFKNMQIDAKVEFLACLEEDRRNKFINKTTQVGTKGREVLEFELARVLENEEAMDYVREQKDKVYGSFVDLVQKRIKSEESTQSIAYSVSKKWLLEISQKSSENLSIAS